MTLAIDMCSVKPHMELPSWSLETDMEPDECDPDRAESRTPASLSADSDGLSAEEANRGDKEPCMNGAHDILYNISCARLSTEINTTL